MPGWESHEAVVRSRWCNQVLNLVLGHIVRDKWMLSAVLAPFCWWRNWSPSNLMENYLSTVASFLPVFLLSPYVFLGMWSELRESSIRVVLTSFWIILFLDSEKGTQCSAHFNFLWSTDVPHVLEVGSKLGCVRKVRVFSTSLTSRTLAHRSGAVLS